MPNFRALFRAITLSATLSIALPMALPALAASNPVSEMRHAFFEQANAALRQANEAQAAVLAPTTYAEGAQYYRRAEQRLDEGGEIEAIRRDLERARAAFVKASNHSGVARATFENTLQARADAVSADARSYAQDQWRKAEERFAEAAVQLENGRLRSAQRGGERASSLYRDAELAAIKANYLSETRNLLEQADDLRAERYAPHSFAMGAQLLEEAETALNTDRYDTDRPRSLAQQAKHNVRHAIYVSKLERRIRDDDTSLEDILLAWENSIRELAGLLDTPIHFDDGQGEAIATIAAGIQELQADNAQLSAGVDERDAQLAALRQDVETLQSRLGGETQAVEQLNQLVAKQERWRQRFAKVDQLFAPEQADVLRKGDNVIIRMIGLNFDVGQATLKPEHYALLSSLRTAIAEFPESNIVIEGHTDAFGSDALNLELSQKRADAVHQYLLANAPISPANLTALGYGESRPVANNETDDGRRKNRRIDVVIYPER